MPLHPIVASLLDGMKARPALADGTVAEARALQAATRPLLGPGPAVHAVRDVVAPTRDGGIRARIIQPSETPDGVIIYLHGGGWVIGELDDFDSLARVLATESRCTVVLPDYRLAPEFPFPAALHDTLDTISWAAANHLDQLAVSNGRIAIAGDSAGANLALAAAVRLQRQGASPLSALGLVYPVVDCDFDRQSYARFEKGFLLTARDMKWFFDHYAPGAVRHDPDVALLRAGGFRGLPETLLLTAAFDVLADEGIELAAKLQDARVKVTHRHVDGLTHGFIRWHNIVDTARDEALGLARFLRACICRPASGAN